MTAFKASLASTLDFLYRNGAIACASSVAWVETQLGLEGHADKVRSLIEPSLYPLPLWLATRLRPPHRISRNKPQDAFVPIGKMWADANLPITTGFHAYQRVFHASNRLAATKPSCVVNQGDVADDSKQFLRQRPDLLLLNPHLLAFVQKGSGVIDNTATSLGFSPLPFSFFE